MNIYEFLTAIIATATGLVSILLLYKYRYSIKALFTHKDWTVYVLDLNGNIVKKVEVPTHTNQIFVSSESKHYKLLHGEKIPELRAFVENPSHGSALVSNEFSETIYCKGKKVERIYFKHKRLVWIGDTPVLFTISNKTVSHKKCKSVLAKHIRRYGIPDVK